MNVKNIWIGSGRICNDIELKVTETGKKVIGFSIAINDGTKERPHTTFIPIEAWENAAETISKYFRKGDQIFVSGRLNVRQYDDRGEKRNKISVVLESFDFGQKKAEEVKEYSRERKEVESRPYKQDILPEQEELHFY